MTPRTRLVWRTAEIKRTTAALAAYAVLGSAGAAVLWGFVVACVLVAQSMS